MQLAIQPCAGASCVFCPSWLDDSIWRWSLHVAQLRNILPLWNVLLLRPSRLHKCKRPGWGGCGSPDRAAEDHGPPHYLDRGGKVFVDSGAFTAFRRNEPMNWNPVFWTYGVLIEGTDHPENLTIVAPDIIGNQDLSVALWEEHRALIRGG